jgi:putative flippase GtrA
MVMRQFAIFIGVGIACAVIDVGLMQVLMLFGAHHVVAATAGFAAGLVANVALHTRVTFSARYTHRILIRFMTVVLANYIITVAFVTLLNDWWSMPVLGKLVSLPVVAVNGFLLSKFWVYR